MPAAKLVALCPMPGWTHKTLSLPGCVSYSTIRPSESFRIVDWTWDLSAVEAKTLGGSETRLVCEFEGDMEELDRYRQEMFHRAGDQEPDPFAEGVRNLESTLVAFQIARFQVPVQPMIVLCVRHSEGLSVRGVRRYPKWLPTGTPSALGESRVEEEELERLVGLVQSAPGGDHGRLRRTLQLLESGLRCSGLLHFATALDHLTMAAGREERLTKGLARLLGEDEIVYVRGGASTKFAVLDVVRSVGLALLRFRQGAACDQLSFIADGPNFLRLPGPHSSTDLESKLYGCALRILLDTLRSVAQLPDVTIVDDDIGWQQYLEGR